MTQRKKIGLALGSGGARGLSHLGILQRFAEWGIPIHCVAGTSIGAIVGGIYAAGTVEVVSEWLRGLNVVDFARLFAGRPHSTGFLTGRGVDEKLRDFIPYTDYCQLPLPFATVATDIATGEEVVIKEGDLLSGIHASFAIPGVFTSVERDGRQLVDGGLSNPLPISVCRAMGADAVIAVDVNLRPGPPNFRRPKDRLKLFDILTNALKFLENEVSRGTLAAQAPDVVIHPAVGDIGTLDFGCVEMGIAAGLSAADEMRADIEALME